MDTVIKDWFLVELYTDKIAEEGISLGINLLWGIVVEDFRLKFCHGNFICTSNQSRDNSRNPLHPLHKTEIDKNIKSYRDWPKQPKILRLRPGTKLLFLI